MNATVYEIVRTHLIENNYGGLLNPHGECGCELEDLEPCDEMSGECRPGYKHLCDKPKDCDSCMVSVCDGGATWYIKEDK